MSTFYTYLWRDSAGVPFYVGKGRDKRAWRTNDRSKEFKQIYANDGCTVEIADEFALESEAHAHEVDLIARYGRRDLGTGLLINKTDGGEGISGLLRTPEHCASGRNMSAETRARITASNRNRTPEYCANLSAAHSNRSAEYRAKLSAAKKGKTHSAETRARMSAAARNMSAEARAKISAAHGNRSADHCAKISAANKGKTHSVETRAKMSAAHKGRPKSP